MKCEHLRFTGHALRQMFAREITEADVRDVVAGGTVIAEYPEDKPLPSCLLLGFADDRPIHVVLGYDKVNETGFVVTAYVPDPDLWHNDSRTRRKP